MADFLGIVAIVFFYVLILVVGIWAGRKSKSTKELESEVGAQTEEVMLAGRNIGTLVGIFTMTATWVGGAYINGTAEALYNGGVLGCQAPVGYAISLVMGGLLFAKKMREEGYITMLDPFQHKYGQRIGGLMYLPALLGETFWTAAILSALGATLSVILGIDMNASVTLSACIAVFYTFTGGYYAVAYTDVVQLFCIFVGLWVCVPAAMVHDGAKDISRNAGDWIGEIGGFKETSLWIDCMLLLVFGGIPWQVYFQRVLSSKTASGAQTLSFVAGVGCILMAIPPALIGAIARNTDWRMTDYSPWNNGTKVESIPPDKRNMVVPLVFQYLTPRWVAFIGLGAVSAAVMSSADSSVLSAASMFAHNIWKLTIRPHASEKEVIIVMRVAIICVGIMATIMALTIQSIYGLWYLCADLVYVILFPQLLCVVYMPRSNTYGSLAGYLVGLVLRLIGGEPLVSLPAFFHYPMYTDGTQYFPFRTTAMLSSMATIYFVSVQSEKLFKSGRLSPEWDVMGCVVNIPIDHVPLPSDVSFAVSSETLNIKTPNGTPAPPPHPNLQPSDENTLLHPYSDQHYYSTSSLISLFFVSLFSFVVGRNGELRTTCEKNPHEFTCYSWCMRLNRYNEMYTKVMNSWNRMWEGWAILGIAFIIPGTVLVFVIWKLYDSYKTHREGYNRRKHRNKMKLVSKSIQNGRMKETVMDRFGKDETPADSIEERPFREGIIHQLKSNKDLENKYLEFRRSRLLKELSNADVKNYKFYDKLVLQREFTDLPYIEKQTADVPKLEKDPEFDNNNVVMEWDVFTPLLKEVAAAAVEAGKAKEIEKARANAPTEIDKTMRVSKQPT